jgi:hypothetical protein
MGSRRLAALDKAMSERCPNCGALIALVGIRHNCRFQPAQQARQIGKTERVRQITKQARTPIIMPDAPPIAPPAQGSEMKKKSAGRPRATPKVPIIDPVKRRPGPPVTGDHKNTLARQKPWKRAGVSRATWFRRKAEKAK